MAMYLMGVMTVAFLVITFIAVFLLNYREGKLVKKQSVFIGILVFVLLGLFINLTGLPSNYITQRLVSMGLILVSIADLFLYKKNFDASRILLSFIAFISLFLYL